MVSKPILRPILTFKPRRKSQHVWSPNEGSDTIPSSSESGSGSCPKIFDMENNATLAAGKPNQVTAMPNSYDRRYDWMCAFEIGIAALNHIADSRGWCC